MGASPEADWRLAEPGPIAGTCVWRVRLPRGPDALARCDRLLSPDERVRADRFLRAEDRDRFRASHAALRLILGRAVGRDPACLVLAAAPGGKPALADAAFDFNLSHSGGLALVGVSAEARIGVDLETDRALPDALRIARAHFAADEVEALAALPEAAQRAAFLALWTCKEAVVKALGDGLARSLAAFSVPLPPHPPQVRFSAGAPPAWTLRRLDPGPGSFAAAALDASDIPIRLAALPPDWADRPA